MIWGYPYFWKHPYTHVCAGVQVSLQSRSTILLQQMALGHVMCIMVFPLHFPQISVNHRYVWGEIIPKGLYISFYKNPSGPHFRDFSKGPPILGPLATSFPYHSHTSRDSYGSSMGMGVPLLGVRGISLDTLNIKDYTVPFDNPTCQAGQTITPCIASLYFWDISIPAIRKLGSTRPP